MNFLKSKFQDSSSLPLVVVAGIASYLDSALLVSTGVALPLWTAKFSLNPWIVGLISTLLTAAVALGSFAGGWLSDKFGRVRVFNVDIFFVALGSVILALAQSLPMILIGVVIAGFASGADLPTSLAVISERMTKDDYGKAIAGTQLFWTIGILLSQLIGSLTGGLGNHATFVIFGVIAVIAFINWTVRMFSSSFKNIEEELAAKQQKDQIYSQEKIPLRTLFKERKYVVSILLLTLFYLAWNLPANTWGSFINYFLVTVSGKTVATASLIALLANILCFLVNVWYLKIADTKRRYPMMYIGIFVAFVSFVVAGIFTKQWLIFAVAYIFYSMSTVLCGESLYKTWSQLFYPMHTRASMTGFSYGLVRGCTAVFSLVTPTVMAISPKMLMWILVGCVVIFGSCGVQIVKLIKKYNIEDPTMI
ncbi:MFS transporter [Enterococcus mediterraneensis]|uniref:MFS transporter n=1 Tax=Enterococcus mediterraneensis TaxID=2364791 RepID=UPI000F051693|nr:MFS transporter [Enterococcus mediterraneensis]